MSFLARPFSIAAMRPSALASLSSFTSLEVDENLTLLPIPHASICGVGLRHPARGVELLREHRQALPGGVHPHLDRAPRGARQGVLHAGGHFREGPAAGRPYAVALDEEGSYPEALVPDYADENVSTKVVKIIQSYTGVVDKMVWRKSL